MYIKLFFKGKAHYVSEESVYSCKHIRSQMILFQVAVELDSDGLPHCCCKHHHLTSHKSQNTESCIAVLCQWKIRE